MVTTKVKKKLSAANQTGEFGKYSPEFTYHFNMSYYLSFETVDTIFNAFEAHFNSSPNASASRNLIINATDSFYNNHTYSFLFRDADEINYAKNMIKIYNILIKDFVRKNKNLLSSYSVIDIIDFNYYFCLTD